MIIEQIFKLAEKKFSKGWKCLPDEVYKELKYIPATFKVLEHHVKVYAGKRDGEGVLRAEVPNRLLAHSIVTPELAAAVFNAKYVNAIPLNRLSEEFLRIGVNIPRQDMAGWMIRLNAYYLKQIHARMKEEIMRSHHVHCDETPFIMPKDGKEYPIAANDTIFRRYVNFIYGHNVRMKYYDGTRSSFIAYYDNLVEQSRQDPTKASEVMDMQTHQYWCTNGFELLRYNYVLGEWVDAGTYNSESLTYTAGVRDLHEDAVTKAAYTAWRTSSDYGDFDKLNDAFHIAIAQDFAANFGKVASVPNHQTHYNLVNFLLAGTDNCSKNLYFQYDPDTGLIFLDQDDLD